MNLCSHRFEPRYDEDVNTVALNILIKAGKLNMSDVLPDLRKQTYVCDICDYCGKKINRRKANTKKEQPMTEDDLNGGVEVEYEGEIHTTGNRRHGLVDLHQKGKFVKCVPIKKIRVVHQI